MTADQLPLGTNLAIFTLWFILAVITSLWLVSYYSSKGTSPVVRITCVVSYVVSFMLMYVTSLDVTGGYREELAWVWLLYYILVSLSCWAIVPFQQDYHDNGGFTWKDKMKFVFWAELFFYIPIVVVGAIFLGYLILHHGFGINQIWSLILNLSNTVGFIMLTFFFGYGLVNLPLTLWQKSNRYKNLQFCLYKLGRLSEEMSAEQDRLQQTTKYLEQLAINCPSHLQHLLPILQNKIPKADTAYSFAFISGQTNMIESFSALEKLQKINISQLKYSNFVTLHYIIVTHRRTLATFTSSWKETIGKYLFLNNALQLAQAYSFQTLSPVSLIAPSDYTYTNFPTSFLWKLPCCCGKRSDERSIDNDDDSLIPATINEMSEPINTGGSISAPMLADSSRDESLLSNDLFLQINQDKAGVSGIDVDQLSPQGGESPGGHNIYDDMSSLSSLPPPSSQSTTDLLNYHSVRLKMQFTSWLFRQQPDLVPGSVYHTLTWYWFKYVVFIQPLMYRIGAITVGLISLVMLWSEISIVFTRNLSPVYWFAHIQGTSVSVQSFLRVLPLSFIIFTTYFTIFNINLGWFFSMLAPQKTNTTSLLFSSSLMLRMVFTTTYNYYQMARVENTAFTTFVGPMEVIPLLGNHFNKIMPFFVVIFAFLTLINCWGTCLRFLGVPHFNFNSLHDRQSDTYIHDGRLLIDNERRRQNGEAVKHFRGKDVDIQRNVEQRRKAREEQRAANGGDVTNYRTNDGEHVRMLKNKYKFGTKTQTNSNSNPPARAETPHNPPTPQKQDYKTHKFASEREARTNLDNW